jgi:gamma-glutamyltranspeptidase/glutathione hydrolase
VYDDVTTTTGAAVAAPHPLAAEAASEMFRAGGNAVDAAVAGMLAVCVCASHSCSLGGYGGSLVIYDAKSKTVSAIDFDSKAPYAFRADDPRQTFANWQLGYLAIGVPGVVAGLSLTVAKFGTKKWADVIAPAIRIAAEGYLVEEPAAKNIAGFAIKADATSIKAMFPSGKFPKAGERWVQADLAKLLERIAADPAAMYHGEVPRAIVKQVRDNGGILAEEDFTRYEARVVEPLTVRYTGDVDLFTPPPPSAGVTTLGILKTLQHLGLAGRQPWGAPYFELLAESMKLCWDERRRHLGDPDFVHPPLAEMLSDESAKAGADRIRSGPARAPQAVDPGENHTANIVTVGPDRSIVSLTSTNGGGWGARVAIQGLGLALGHGMSRFAADPKSPNAPAPGKRVQHNMAPLLMLKGGDPVGVVGMAGGTRIPNATAQLVVSLLDFKASPAKTLDAPRLHTEGNEPLEVTKNLPDPVFNELQLMGHQVKRVAGVGGPLNAALLGGRGKTVTIASTSAKGAVKVE